ncbi:hypothetical protein H0W91_02700 [Patescibacteria group bacterium]|nr:hypothetical protein [Patescibacteria group bacterium]
MGDIALRQEIRQALLVIGGMTNSIFPEVEALLLAPGNDYLSGLQYIASKKVMSRYESIIDFLFCELNPEHRFACQRYYTGAGKQLQDLITLEERVQYQKELLVALRVASERFQEKRRESWRSYVDEVQEQIFMAS